jgi:NTE family protein
MEYYAIFEGGGAKGIAHAAAYASAVEADIEFAGVAGASAGAIFASLVAFGYRPLEIFDQERPTKNVLAEVAGVEPVDLVGGKDAFSRLMALFAQAPKLFGWPLPISMALGYSLYRKFANTLTDAKKNLGFLDTKALQVALNKAYRMKLVRLYELLDNAGANPQDGSNVRALRNAFEDDNKLVRFGDLARAREHAALAGPGAPRFCDLKIVVTDITRRELVLCESRAFPELGVAEAVAASVSIPVVFRPATRPVDPNFAAHWSVPSVPGDLRGLRQLEDRDQRTPSQFADGGLVSNLPVWAFEQERQLSVGGARVFAFSLVDSEPSPEALARRRASERAPGAYLGAVARTAIFGGQKTAQNFVTRMTLVPVPCDLGVLDFDLTMDSAIAAYLRARRATRGLLLKEIKYRPQVVAGILGAIRDLATDGLTRYGQQVAPHDVRIAVAVPFGNDALRVEPGNTFNMERTGADDFLLPNDAVGFGYGFATGDIKVAKTSDIADRDPRANPYVGARLRSLAATLMAVPIRRASGGSPVAVVGVFAPENCHNAMASLSQDAEYTKLLVDQCRAWVEIEATVESLARAELAKAV